jgi:hypothetical protein
VTQALRYCCRNPRCRSKLSAPVSNPREAFCARGCHSSFYRKRCIACEQPMERKRESQQLCGRRKCEGQFKVLKAHFLLGRYHPSSAAVEASKNPIKPGTFSALKTDRAWRQVAGPELSERQLRLATVDAGAVERSNRTSNRQHWRAAGSAALIQRDTMPVNIVGGYKFPNALRIELTAGDPRSPQNPTLAIADGDDLPAFLDHRPGGQDHAMTEIRIRFSRPRRQGTTEPAQPPTGIDIVVERDDRLFQIGLDNDAI